MPALERLVGPVAYRGRQTMVKRKQRASTRAPYQNQIERLWQNLNLSKRNVPTHTIASERSTYSGPRRPGQRRN